MMIILLSNMLLNLYLATISGMGEMGDMLSSIKSSEKRIQMTNDQISCQEFQEMERIQDTHSEEIICP